MRKLIFILFMGCCFSCNTPYYATVNNMGRQPATLTLKNGKTLTGKIEVKTFDNYSNIGSIAFAQGLSKIYKAYDIAEIESLFFNGSNYSLKNLKGNEMWGGNALRFVKELTSTNSKIRLFEHEIAIKSNNGAIVPETQLFIQLPDNSIDVYNSQSEKFIPYFDEKVAPYFANCEALFESIKAKDPNFFYAFVNQGPTKRKQVWMNIVNALNQCK